MSIQKALQMAEKEGLDLVEISPNAVPPVCRLIDYSKFLYQQKKRQKSQAENEAQRIANEEAKRREEEERRKRAAELERERLRNERDDFGNRPQGPFGF